MEIVHVQCIKCQQNKPETEFHKGTGRYSNGRKSTCKACQKSYMKDYYAEHGDKIRKQATEHYQNNKERHIATTTAWVKNNQRRVKDLHLQRKFGITIEHYEQLLAEQDGVCAICKEPPERTRLAVDHDHSTGAIRGLLCSDCNTAIGLLGDDPSTIQSALTYLTNNNPTEREYIYVSHDR